jgi:hypothetical protein
MLVVSAAVGAAILLPTILAHNATLAPEQYVRFLSDCSDDWGGHSAVRDGHDLVALDLMERWLPDAGPALFVMLTVGFGFAEANSQGGPLADEIEIAAPPGPIKVRLTSSDNKVFTAESGSGLRKPDVILPTRPSLLPSGVQDGSRILIEFGFRYDTLSLKVGDKVTAAKAQAFARGDRGDMMPGGYYVLGVASGGDRECPQSGHQGGGDPGTLYVRTDYTLRGTESPYLSTSANSDALAVSGNQTGFLTLEIKNKLSKQAQTFTVKTSLAPPWEATVEPPTAKATLSGSASFDVRVRAPNGVASNTSLVLTIDSDVGGHGTKAVPLYWYPAGVEPTIPSKTVKGSPAVAGPICIAAIMFLVWTRRGH